MRTRDIPYRGKKSRGKFSSWKNLVTSEKLVTFLWPIFKIKRSFIIGTIFFFQRKIVLLVWDFSTWARRSALLVSLNLFFYWFLKFYNFQSLQMYNFLLCLYQCCCNFFQFFAFTRISKFLLKLLCSNTKLEKKSG